MYEDSGGRRVWRGNDHSLPEVTIMIDEAWDKKSLKAGFSWVDRN